MPSRQRRERRQLFCDRLPPVPASRRAAPSAPVWKRAAFHDVLAKSIGSRNAINMAYATMAHSKALSAPETIAANRGLEVNQLVPWLAKARKEEADAAY